MNETKNNSQENREDSQGTGNVSNAQKQDSGLPGKGQGGVPLSFDLKDSPSFKDVDTQELMVREALRQAGHEIINDLVAFIRTEIGDNVLFITGKSGAGKDYLARTQLKDIPYLLLDSVGEQRDQKWVVIIDKLKAHLDAGDEDPVFIGTCDNLAEIGLFLRDYYNETAKLICIMIVPIPFIWIQATAGKADETEKKNGNAQWIKGWREAQKWPLKKVIKYLVDEVGFKADKLSPDRTVVWINSTAKDTKITEGWDKGEKHPGKEQDTKGKGGDK